MSFNKTYEKGITLVALVITIIILLILAGVAIAQLTGNGLFENAKLAKEKHENAQELENTILGDYETKIGEYVDGTRDTVTISKEEYNRLKNNMNYSIDEQVIGTWVDGKPIYRFITPVTIPTTTTEGKSVYADVLSIPKDLNINSYVKFSGYYVDNTGTWLNILPNKYTNVYVDKNYGHIRIENASVAQSGRTGYIIVEYTKTTD